MRDELRYKDKEQKIFEQMEDLLDDERIRQKIEVLEQQEITKSKSVVESPRRGSEIGKPGHMKHTSEMIGDRKAQQLALPEIGSFGLIQDLVKDFTSLSKK